MKPPLLLKPYQYHQKLRPNDCRARSDAQIRKTFERGACDSLVAWNIALPPTKAFITLFIGRLGATCYIARRLIGECHMKYGAWFVVGLAASCLLACQDREDDINNVPVYSTTRTTSASRSLPPRAPDPGTYTGDSRGNPRPPLSGLNSDPTNPNGVPGKL